MLKRPLLTIAALALATSSTVAFADPQAPPAVVADLRQVCAAGYEAEFNKFRSAPHMSHIPDSDIRLQIDAQLHSIGRTSALAHFDEVLADWGHDPFMRCLINRRMAVLRGEAKLGQAPAASRAAPPPLPPTSQSAPAASVAARNQTAAAAGAALPSRIIARDGRTAMDCVKLVSVASGDSQITGIGGRVLSNQCEGTVTVRWCYVGGECERDAGNSWTIQPGRSWPVSAEKEIRWAACHGANTFHNDPGSKGLQFTCSAPVQ